MQHGTRNTYDYSLQLHFVARKRLHLFGSIIVEPKNFIPYEITASIIYLQTLLNDNIDALRKEKNYLN